MKRKFKEDGDVLGQPDIKLRKVEEKVYRVEKRMREEEKMCESSEDVKS